MSNPDEYQSIPVALARAAVQESGQLAGIEGPHYLSALSVDWRPYFAPGDGVLHPEFARVIVTRKDQAPREVVISWEEYAAELELNDPNWAEKRKQKPMSIFGAEVERHAYRVAFADVLAAAFPPVIRENRSYGDADPHISVTREWEPPRDWAGEVSKADAKTLNGLYDEAREAGVLVKVDGLQQAFSDRMLQLAAVKAITAPAVTPAQIADVARVGQSLPPRPPEQGNRRRRGKR